jgi:hypothetical protein
MTVARLFDCLNNTGRAAAVRLDRKYLSRYSYNHEPIRHIHAYAGERFRFSAVPKD